MAQRVVRRVVRQSTAKVVTDSSGKKRLVKSDSPEVKSVERVYQGGSTRRTFTNGREEYRDAQGNIISIRQGESPKTLSEQTAQQTTTSAQAPPTLGKSLTAEKEKIGVQEVGTRTLMKGGRNPKLGRQVTKEEALQGLYGPRKVTLPEEVSQQIEESRTPDSRTISQPPSQKVDPEQLQEQIRARKAIEQSATSIKKGIEDGKITRPKGGSSSSSKKERKIEGPFKTVDAIITSPVRQYKKVLDKATERGEKLGGSTQIIQTIEKPGEFSLYGKTFSTEDVPRPSNVTRIIGSTPTVLKGGRVETKEEQSERLSREFVRSMGEAEQQTKEDFQTVQARKREYEVEQQKVFAVKNVEAQKEVDKLGEEYQKKVNQAVQAGASKHEVDLLITKYKIETVKIQQKYQKQAEKELEPIREEIGGRLDQERQTVWEKYYGKVDYDTPSQSFTITPGRVQARPLESFSALQQVTRTSDTLLKESTRKDAFTVGEAVEVGTTVSPVFLGSANVLLKKTDAGKQVASVEIPGKTSYVARGFKAGSAELIRTQPEKAILVGGISIGVGAATAGAGLVAPGAAAAVAPGIKIVGAGVGVGYVGYTGYKVSKARGPYEKGKVLGKQATTLTIAVAGSALGAGLVIGGAKGVSAASRFLKTRSVETFGKYPRSYLGVSKQRPYDPLKIKEEVRLLTTQKKIAGRVVPERIITRQGFGKPQKGFAVKIGKVTRGQFRAGKYDVYFTQDAKQITAIWKVKGRFIRKTTTPLPKQPEQFFKAKTFKDQKELFSYKDQRLSYGQGIRTFKTPKPIDYTRGQIKILQVQPKGKGTVSVTQEVFKKYRFGQGVQRLNRFKQLQTKSAVVQKENVASRIVTQPQLDQTKVYALKYELTNKGVKIGKINIVDPKRKLTGTTIDFSRYKKTFDIRKIKKLGDTSFKIDDTVKARFFKTFKRKGDIQFYSKAEERFIPWGKKAYIGVARQVPQVGTGVEPSFSTTAPTTKVGVGTGVRITTAPDTSTSVLNVWKSLSEPSTTGAFGSGFIGGTTAGLSGGLAVPNLVTQGEVLTEPSSLVTPDVSPLTISRPEVKADVVTEEIAREIPARVGTSISTGTTPTTPTPSVVTPNPLYFLGLPFGFPRGGSGSGKKKTEAKSRPIKTVYTPSLAAVQFGIYGKSRKKKISGLSIRPIPLKYKNTTGQLQKSKLLKSLKNTRI